MMHGRLCDGRSVGVIDLVLVFGGLGSPVQALRRYPRPYMEITITPLVDGLLETFQVDRGDLMKEGQILAHSSSRSHRSPVNNERNCP